MATDRERSQFARFALQLSRSAAKLEPVRSAATEALEALAADHPLLDELEDLVVRLRAN